MPKRSLDLARLATMSPAELRLEWERVLGGTPPVLPPERLRRVLAQRMQEKRHGALPALVARELARVAARTGAEPAPPRARAAIRPGVRLVREWRGRTISVEVVESGFLFEGERYASLSIIAKQVTGAHWSGPRFFGITGRG